MNSDRRQPTLWRTCRVLANETRLRLLAQLARKQPQSVSELAQQMSLTLPVASQSLRALESRGLLQVRRIHRWVEYRLPAPGDAGSLDDLMAALQAILRQNPDATEQVMKLATGFTHPARIEIFRSLRGGPRTQAQIQSATQLSFQALARHLRKLISRGYVHLQGETYQQVSQPDNIGRALSSLISR